MEHPLAKFLEKDLFVNSIGITLTEIGKGTAAAQLTVTPGHCNAAENIQGGVVFTLADFTFAAAANSHMKIAVTLNASIQYIKGVSAGAVLYAKAKEISCKRKISNYQVDVTDETGDLVALFMGTAYIKEISIASLM